jgi:hypothetical protein
MDAATMGQDPSQGDPSEQPEEAGTSVCIKDNEDGTYTVSLMGDADSDPSDTADQAQTAQSLEDALKLAGQMLSGEASEDQAEPDDGSDGDTPMAPDDAKKMWNQMATSRAKQKAMG